MPNRFKREAIVVGLLPILLVAIGLMSGLVAPHWFRHICEVKAEPTLTAPQEILLSDFRACLKALPKRVTSTVVSPCAERSVVFLTDLPGATFTKWLGQPDWCRKSARSDLILWSERDCLLSPVWGYSFYRIPAIGGGPELEITFDQTQTSTAVSWVHSQ